MGTTPNFLWLEAILRSARAYLGARPDSPHTAQYLESVIAAQEVFERTRRETDDAYTTWRRHYHEVITAHKRLRLVYDAARQECIEWGLDGYPDRFISYLEEEDTQRSGQDMIVFLERLEVETDWHEQAVAELSRALTEAREAIQIREAQFRRYRVKVRERKLGYDRAYALARELFDALRGELDRGSDDYRKLSPYPLM